MGVLQFIDENLAWLILVFGLVDLVMWLSAGGSGLARQGIRHISRRPVWFRALLPFVWICCLVIVLLSLIHIVVAASVNDTADIIIGAICGALYGYDAHDWYHRWKNTDDDFWKKKREKVAGKIAEVAGKLVVVPEPVPVPVRA